MPPKENPVTRMIGPGTTKASQTLYERIGGEQKLDNIVTGVYNGMKADKEIGKFFARFRLEKLKERTVDYLRGEWGGDPYKGSDLWIAHSHLGVTNHQYDIMMKLYVKMLKKERIPKAETEECLASLEKMRAPCVDRDLKFKNMYLKHTEQLAAKAGGDGWGKPAVNEEERLAKERATQENVEKARQEEAKREEAKKLVGSAAPDGKAAAAKAKAAPAPKAEAAASPAAAGAASAPAAKAQPKAAPSTDGAVPNAQAKAKAKAKGKAKAKAAPDAGAPAAAAVDASTEAKAAAGSPRSASPRRAASRGAATEEERPDAERITSPKNSARSAGSSTRVSSGEVEVRTPSSPSGRTRSRPNRTAEDPAKALQTFIFAPIDDKPPELMPPTLLAGALLSNMKGVSIPVSL